MQIKTTIRYHFTSIMVAIIKYTYTHTYVKQITWVSEDVEKLDPSWTAASGKVN